MKLHHSFAPLLMAILFTVAAVAEASAQSPGIITGTVTDARTGQPMAGAQLSIVGTQRGSVTSLDGTYRIGSVPPGEHQVRASFIGFRSSILTVTVTAGGTSALNFTMAMAVIDMDEIVVTGVVGEMSRGRLPFTVDRVSQADLAVTTSGSPVQMLTGKIAGATIIGSSGRPGAPPSVMLRGPTSINLSGRSQDPLYIVDGVILSSSILDFDGMDIESIEVIKGAAAASLYGARAANGVIQITTQRGRNVADNSVRYTLRSEFGKSDLTGEANITQRHAFALNQSGTMFLTSTGTECNFAECGNIALAGQRALPGANASLWNTVQRERFPGQTFNQVDRLFDPGNHLQSSISVAGRSGATNYHLSVNHLNEDGTMEGHGGAKRTNFRLNLDQSMRDDLTVGASVAYMRNRFDERDGPVFQLTRMPAGVDLLAPDPLFPEFFILKPDPNNDNANPMNTIRNTITGVDRVRFTGSASATWQPLEWLDIDGMIAFDRLDRNFGSHQRRGVRSLDGSAGEGAITRNHRRVEGMNTAVTARTNHRFGDLLVTNSVRYLFEREDNIFVTASSSLFTADGVFTIDNTPTDRQSASSSFFPERRDGFFLNTILDYRDRYLIDGLVRQDGNSRFGADARRSWYYRVAGSYVVSEEDWFNLPRVSNAALRYARGTAGSAPTFSGQFETFNVGDGVITPGVLGNRNLKPELTTEDEFGLAFSVGRISTDVTYARSNTEDALLLVPQLAFAGFSQQWQNAASLKSNTIEVTLSAQAIQTQNFSWNTRVLFDRTRQEVTGMSVPPFSQGTGGQGQGSAFFVRPGERLGTFFGFQFAENCGHLPAGVDCSQFAVNDDGLLVWIGNAGSAANGWDTFVDETGVTRTYWGSSSNVDIRGQTPLWGQPFQAEAFDRVTGESTTFLPVGQTTPDYTLAFANTFTYKNFSAYGLIRSVQGFDVWNQSLQWATFQDFSGIMDQSNVPEAQQKPIGYYSTLYNASGLVPNSFFTGDASFTKLQEVRLAYRLDSNQLDRLLLTRGFSALTMSLSGHNLFTWTDYDGFDPDIGITGGGTGSAATARIDGFSMPPFRTFTFGFDLTF